MGERQCRVCLPPLALVTVVLQSCWKGEPRVGVGIRMNPKLISSVGSLALCKATVTGALAGGHALCPAGEAINGYFAHEGGARACSVPSP